MLITFYVESNMHLFNIIHHCPIRRTSLGKIKCFSTFHELKSVIQVKNYTLLTTKSKNLFLFWWEKKIERRCSIFLSLTHLLHNNLLNIKYKCRSYFVTNMFFPQEWIWIIILKLDVYIRVNMVVKKRKKFYIFTKRSSIIFQQIGLNRYL